MTSNAFRADRLGAVALDAVLAHAGEGTIREVLDHPGTVAKVFHPELKNLPEKTRKVAAMVRNRPSGAVQKDGFVVLTWPTHILRESGSAVGYLMPRIDTSNAVEIHQVSNPSQRAEPLPSSPQWVKHSTWQHLLSVAANLCLAVQTVHRTRAVIGDFQERNILVSDTTRVTLVDCDSMQFTDTDGHRYLCAVGRPEFTAPELSGLDLRTSPRERSSDLFALAVHIHVLLMAGNHPFLRGNWTGSGEQPEAMALARAGQWAGGPGSLLRSHPLAPPINFLPDEILRLFARAFTVGARDPQARPTAEEWRSVLLAVELKECPRGHQLPVGGRGCPWCAIDGERTHRRSERIPATPVPSRRILHAGPPPEGVPASTSLRVSASASAPPSSRLGPRSATGTRVTPAQRVFLCGAAILGVLAVAIAAIIMLVG